LTPGPKHRMIFECFRLQCEPMSSYENYSTTSAHYDSTRDAIGVEIVLGCLARSGRPLSEQVLLDAGCGTGNYSRALIEHVARIEAVDMNEGMLAVAANKLEEFQARARIRFHRASIEELPLDDASVDGVMINQVLHHLADDPGAGWPVTRKVLGEFARVLRPGGVLVVNTCSREQLRRGWWLYALVESAVERMLARFVPLAEFEALMATCGLEPCGRFVPTDAVVQGESYFDPRGPLDPTWRAGDSLWSTVSAGEIESVESRLRAMDARGELDAFVARQDAERIHVGQTTFLCAAHP